MPHLLPWASPESVTCVENRVIELESAVNEYMHAVIRVNKKLWNQDVHIKQLMQDVMDKALKCIIRAIRLVNRRNNILEARWDTR